MTTNPIKLLIVDDDEDLLFLLKHQLTAIGYIVDLCPNGEGCIGQLDILGSHIVLLDLTMNGIRGEDLCREIKSRPQFREVKILIMSGNHDIRNIANACGADGIVAKPVTPASISEQVSRHIRK